MGKKITVANLVMLAGAAVATLFSFFNFYKYGSDGRNAWSRDLYAYVSTIPAILAIVMLAWGVAELAGANLPKNVLTFTAAQLKATWGISAAGVMLAFFTVEQRGLDKGIGFWFMAIGSAAMAVGAVMGLLGKGANVVNLGGGGGGQQAVPPPGYGTPPPGYTPPPPGYGTPPPPPPPPPPAG